MSISNAELAQIKEGKLSSYQDISMYGSIKVSLFIVISLSLFGCGGGGGGNTSEELGEHPVGEAPPASEPPASEPPASEPPASEPPASEPPASEPPASEPPASEPPASEPPASEPPASEPPASEPPVSEPPATPPVVDSFEISSKPMAARFLTQATFGPTSESIDQLFSIKNYEKWINRQFAKPATLHLPKVKALGRKMCAYTSSMGEARIDSWEFAYPRHQIWWETALHAEDQLRQRVALALSEILVVSDSEGLGLSEFELGVTSYYDVLVKHAFGNFRDLLEAVTLHPAMGDFLSMTRNRKANVAEGIRPDENYAREILQLFSIGVHELNLDGSIKKDANGQPIPTYNQKTIEEFAKVFTGWSYADIPWDGYFGDADHTIPLKAFEQYHDKTEKTLLNGAKSPANQTAQADLDFALDNIFNHPNVAPFISKRLIQRLITSNPSPDYVAQVAKVFNDNGNGVRGDLKAVVKAILLDVHARSNNRSDHFGKLREPMLRISHLWRAFNMQTSLKKGHYWEPDKTCGQGAYPYYNFWTSLDYFKTQTGQGPLQAKSVFNFFKPGFAPAGELNASGLVAPEFQIVNENTITGTSNLLHEFILEFSDSKALTPVVEGFSKLNLGKETALASNVDALLNHLDLILFSGEMSSGLRNIIKSHLTTTKKKLAENDYYPVNEHALYLAKEAILLAISSPEYLIQR